MAINWGTEAGAFADGLTKGAETVSRVQYYGAETELARQRAEVARQTVPWLNPDFQKQWDDIKAGKVNPTLGTVRRPGQMPVPRGMAVPMATAPERYEQIVPNYADGGVVGGGEIYPPETARLLHENAVSRGRIQSQIEEMEARSAAKGNWESDPATALRRPPPRNPPVHPGQDPIGFVGPPKTQARSDWPRDIIGYPYPPKNVAGYPSQEDVILTDPQGKPYNTAERLWVNRDWAVQGGEPGPTQVPGYAPKYADGGVVGGMPAQDDGIHPNDAEFAQSYMQAQGGGGQQMASAEDDNDLGWQMDKIMGVLASPTDIKSMKPGQSWISPSQPGNAQFVNDAEKIRPKGISLHAKGGMVGGAQRYQAGGEVERPDAQPDAVPPPTAGVIPAEPPPPEPMEASPTETQSRGLTIGDIWGRITKTVDDAAAARDAALKSAADAKAATKSPADPGGTNAPYRAPRAPADPGGTNAPYPPADPGGTNAPYSPAAKSGAGGGARPAAARPPPVPTDNPTDNKVVTGPTGTTMQRTGSRAVVGGADDDLAGVLNSALNGAQRHASRQLGVGDDGRVVPDSNGQGKAQMLAGNGAANPAAVAKIDQTLYGASPGFSDALKSTSRMMLLYNFYASRGMNDRADAMAYELVQYSAMVASMHGREAMELARQGNIAGAAQKVADAYNSVPNGQHVEIKGNQAIVYDQFTGQPVQSVPMDPRLILTLAQGFEDKGMTYSLLHQRAAGYQQRRMGKETPLKQELIRAQIRNLDARTLKAGQTSAVGGPASETMQHIYGLGPPGTGAPAGPAMAGPQQVSQGDANLTDDQNMATTQSLIADDAPPMPVQNDMAGDDGSASSASPGAPREGPNFVEEGGDVAKDTSKSNTRTGPEPPPHVLGISVRPDPDKPGQTISINHNAVPPVVWARKGNTFAPVDPREVNNQVLSARDQAQIAELQKIQADATARGKAGKPEADAAKAQLRAWGRKIDHDTNEHHKALAADMKAALANKFTPKAAAEFDIDLETAGKDKLVAPYKPALDNAYATRELYEMTKSIAEINHMSPRETLILLGQMSMAGTADNARSYHVLGPDITGTGVIVQLPTQRSGTDMRRGRVQPVFINAHIFERINEAAAENTARGLVGDAHKDQVNKIGGEVGQELGKLRGGISIPYDVERSNMGNIPYQ